ncbi:MAG: Tex-like N-terminal domain-containing protein, partial [Oscillospiraceae bacterium]
MIDILQKLTSEFNIRPEQTKSAVDLIDDGNTIPFIARYPKEATGRLVDHVLRELNDRLNYLRGLEKRKEEIITNIDSQGKLTEELTKSIQNSLTLAEIEDLYRPYKQKRKTRASVARERGLEPLSAFLMEQMNGDIPLKEAEKYISDDVLTATDALNGAMDIIAEDIADRADLRKSLRAFIYRTGKIATKATTTEIDTV